MSNWLGSVRELHKKTQRDVALALKTTDRTVSNWELRGGNPKLTYDQWVALCKLFGCSFDELGQIIVNFADKDL
jgi:transcriptional regulator with XRE-family HTH domain